MANIICSVALGKHYQHNETDFVSLVNAYHSIQDNIIKSSVTDFFPFLRYLPGDILKKKVVLKNIEHFRGLMDSYVQEHKMTFDSNNLRDFVDCYINELRHGDKIFDKLTGKYKYFS